MISCAVSVPRNPMLGAGGFDGNFASLFPGAYQVVQTDRGLTYGSTTLATGTAPPAGTLSGTLSTAPIPIWFKCTTAGVIGVGAVFSAYADGLGVTPFQTGIFPNVPGLPQALTGPATGLSHAWAAGTASLDNVWKATCAALADQSGNGNHYTQGTASRQPIISAGLNGKPGLLFDGADDFLASSLAPSFTWGLYAVFRATTIGAQVSYFGPTAGSGGILFTQSGNPNVLQMYSGGLGPTSGMASGAWSRVNALFTGSTSDALKTGSAAVVSGASASANVRTGAQIGANASVQCSPMEFLAAVYYPGVVPFAAADAGVNSPAGYGAGNVAI